MNGLNFSEMFKNLGSMKARAEELQHKMARLQITGEAGAGMVKVTVSGDGVVKNVKIEPTLLSPNDRDMLEELLIAAINEAQNKAREAMAHEMKSLTGSIPGLEKMFGG
ncbi:MAG: YbaB/EbfC family nucleoid-associated protein [Leptospirales bacterium]|nr:YbaB/EbfC family nucleoid-associated protein [Leptospirales bacterium]